MNKLQHIEEFDKLLDGYQPSQATIKAAKDANLTILVGPSGSGRNSIINYLTDNYDYQYLVSDTTRKPRVNNGAMEKHGVNYFFISEEEFLQRLRQGKYIEAAVVHRQQVSGISIEQLLKVAKQSKTALDEIEIVGTVNLLAHVPDTLAVFILPPSFDEWMNRWNKRGDMDQSEKRRRLVSSEKEIQTAIERNNIRFVVNDTVKNAAIEIDKLVRLHRNNKLGSYSYGEDVEEIAWRILNRVKRELYS